MRNIITSGIENNLSLMEEIKDDFIPLIEDISLAIIERIKAGGTIYWCGNGGSAGQAQHLSAELVGGYYSHDRPPIASVSLTTDTSMITAWANDTDFDSIFSRQLEALGKPEDVLIGLSTSGNSANVLRAFQTARGKSILTIAFTGQSGGALKSHADMILNIPCKDTPRIQEAHLLVGHILCEIIEKQFS
ncbi:MAG: SIS domain-containing protein [Fidelibacterota bacterium]